MKRRLRLISSDKRRTPVAVAVASDQHDLEGGDNNAPYKYSGATDTNTDTDSPSPRRESPSRGFSKGFKFKSCCRRFGPFMLCCACAVLVCLVLVYVYVSFGICLTNTNGPGCTALAGTIFVPAEDDQDDGHGDGIIFSGHQSSGVGSLNHRRDPSTIVHEPNNSRNDNGKDTSTKSTNAAAALATDTDTDTDIAAGPRIRPKFCDSQTKFIENCNPQPTNCTEIIEKNFSTHGIGNALMISYSNEAKPIFQKKCRPILRDYADSEFQLLNYVRVPEYAVSVSDSKYKSAPCIIHALTQPLPNVQTKIDQILRPDQQHLPLVAVHVRTGWADELVRRQHIWDKFNTDICSHNDVAPYVHNNNNATRTSGQIPNKVDRLADPLGQAIYDTAKPEFHLDGMLDDVKQKANAKYGRQQWRFFVASDAPAVKQYASEYLKGNYVGDEALMIHGLVSHNYGNDSIPRSATDTEDINTNSFADLIILSESSMLGYTSSKYPGVAALRSQCPQDIVFMSNAHPRHDLALVADLAGKYIDGRISDEHEHEHDNERSHFEDPSNYDSLLDQLRQYLPKTSRSCLDSNQPILACVCWIKQAHA
uniref:Uncharacterized protein n=1 Tax=Chaetoceros debilis TaxID=122233 RepID=A0A7S3QAU4_9STRA